MRSYLKAFRKYAVLRGRTSRPEYWMYVLINVIMILTLILLDTLLSGEAEIGVGSITTAYRLAVMLPTTAIIVRRLHDTNRSGWFSLISLIPVVGPIILFAFLLQDSQPGNNKYGPSPLRKSA